MMNHQPLNIALDGPAGAGKSTVAKALAGKMDILYLDTGALYRTLALAALRANIAPEDENAVCGMLPGCRVDVRYQNGRQVTLLNGEDVSALLRTPEVSRMASPISAHACVRQAMLGLQRKIASQHACVLDGRDIGTQVLPDCPHKFYVTASVEERARRRWLEEKSRGVERALEEVQRDIAQRDERDSTRKQAPLRRADDAVLIDTTGLTVDEVLEKIMGYLPQKGELRG
nr:(d)CMP kinase [bacterium]